MSLSNDLLLFDLPQRTHTTQKSTPCRPEKKMKTSHVSQTVSMKPQPQPQPQTQLTLDTFMGISIPRELETKLDSYYWIKKPLPAHISETEWKLMATPISKSSVEPMESYPLYEEHPQWIGVPRFYGNQKFGPVCISKQNLSNGTPMSKETIFTWNLENTKQKPQTDAVNAWIKNNGEGVLCLPCGCGKTVIAIYLAVLKHCRTLILVHNEGLMEQWLDRIRAICPKAHIGIIQQDVFQVEGMDLVVGMIQTVYKTSQDLSSFGMVIVDECHHISARTFSLAVRKMNPRYVLGLSATPTRSDGLTEVIHWLLGPMVYHTKRYDVHPQRITQIVYEGGNQKVIQYKNGQLGVPKMLTRMTLDAKRNFLISVCINRLLQNTKINKIIVISDRRDHLVEMNETYQKHSHCGLYIGSLKKKQREEAKSCKIIFATYGMAKEFLDIPGLNGLVLATPCIVDIEQVIGRLRENLSPEFEACADIDEDAIYGEEIECQLKKTLNPITFLKSNSPFRTNSESRIIDNIISYCKNPISRERIVYDIVDPFSIFEGLSWKRNRVYKNLNYICRRIKDQEFLDQK